MRVRMLCKDAVIGGTGRHVVELARALGEQGIHVEIIAPRGRDTELALDGCRVVRPRSFGRLWSTELSPGLVWQGLARPIDILHVHLPSPFGLATIAARGAGRARGVVVTYHCDLDRMFGPLGHAYNDFAQLALRQADAIVISSDGLRASRVLTHHRERLTTIPFGIDPRRMHASPRTDARAAELRHTHLRGHGLVVFVGRLVYYKGLPTLLQAMRHVDAGLLVVGAGPERSRLEHLAAELGLGARVAFAGEVADHELPAFYQAADVVTLPSVGRGEAFGIVQIEAALMERPVVSSRLPGVASVNVDGETGLSVPPGDPVELGRALVQLIEDRDLARRMGSAARKRALTQYSVEMMAERTVQLYRTVLDSA